MPNDHSTLDAAAATDLDPCREYVIYQVEERKRRPAAIGWTGCHDRRPGQELEIQPRRHRGARAVER